jgi:hypothetical protein
MNLFEQYRFLSSSDEITIYSFTKPTGLFC